jgi:hypothetical protein
VFTGTAGVPPAQVVAKVVRGTALLALKHLSGRDARGPSEELEWFERRLML